MPLEDLAEGEEPWSGELTFVEGSFDIGDERLPYFAVNVPVGDAANLLAFAKEVVFDPTEPVEFEELIQREIEDSRPQKIEDYLMRDNRIKFFNSFTVALLPVNPGNQVKLEKSFPVDDAQSTNEGSFTVTDLETIRIKRLTDGGKVGYLRWNTKRIKPVIIDGQHRFRAIKNLLKDDAKRTRLRPADTAIPVIFLVLHKDAGFVAPDAAEQSVIAACRSIFIDLNKHAEAVDATRQYLLDDRDHFAVSLRAILSREIGVSASDPESDSPTATIDRVQATGRLPLALVDWWSNMAKFDQGLYLTTVSVLYDIVEATLGIHVPTSATDYEGFEACVEELSQRLDLVGTSEDWLPERILERLERNSDNEIPFDFSDREVLAIGDGFRRTLGTLVVDPLSQLLPYRELAERYTAADLLNGKYELWLGSDRDGKDAFQSGLETGDEQEPPMLAAVAAEIAESVKSDFGLAFQVVFQKGFIRSLVLLDARRSDLGADWYVDGEIDRESLVGEWCRRFDDRLGPWLHRDAGDPRLTPWYGSGIRPGNRIHYAKAAISNIARLVSVAVTAPVDAWPDNDASVGLLALLDQERTAAPTAYASREVEVAALAWLEDCVEQAALPDGTSALAARYAADWVEQLERYVETRAAINEEQELDDESRRQRALTHAAHCLALIAYGSRAEQ